MILENIEIYDELSEKNHKLKPIDEGLPFPKILSIFKKQVEEVLKEDKYENN